jgi:hypothetical protein
MNTQKFYVWQKQVYPVLTQDVILHKNVKIYHISCEQSNYKGPVFVDQFDECLCDSEEMANLRKLIIAYKTAIDFCERSSVFVPDGDRSIQSFFVESVYLHPFHVEYRARHYASNEAIYLRSHEHSMFSTSLDCELFLKKQELHLKFYQSISKPSPAIHLSHVDDCFYDVECGYPRYNRVLKFMNWMDVEALGVEGQSCLCAQQWSSLSSTSVAVLRSDVPRFSTYEYAKENVDTRKLERQTLLNIGQLFYILQANDICQYVIFNILKQDGVVQYDCIDLATQLHTHAFTSETENMFLTIEDAVLYHKVKIFENWHLVHSGTELLCTETMFERDLAG